MHGLLGFLSFFRLLYIYIVLKLHDEPLEARIPHPIEISHCNSAVDCVSSTMFIDHVYVLEICRVGSCVRL